MERINRDPEKFEVIELYDSISLKKNLKLNDDASEKIFIDSIQTSLRCNKTPILIHGRRIEAMFGFIAASLGKCSFLKKEDSGDVFTDQKEVEIPDYRIIMRTGKQFLVEVKNCHKKGNSKLSFKSSYLNSLKSYASLVNLELKIAIYWSRWNRWVLISPEDLQQNDSVYVASLTDSLKKNQMAMLGDMLIGTTPPLVLKLLSDSKKQRCLDSNGRASFTVKDVELSCAGQNIIDKQEKNIAFSLMM